MLVWSQYVALRCLVAASKQFKLRESFWGEIYHSQFCSWLMISFFLFGWAVLYVTRRYQKRYPEVLLRIRTSNGSFVIMGSRGLFVCLDFAYPPVSGSRKIRDALILLVYPQRTFSVNRSVFTISLNVCFQDTRVMIARLTPISRRWREKLATSNSLNQPLCRPTRLLL